MELRDELAMRYVEAMLRSQAPEVQDLSPEDFRVYKTRILEVLPKDAYAFADKMIEASGTDPKCD